MSIETFTISDTNSLSAFGDITSSIDFTTVVDTDALGYGPGPQGDPGPTGGNYRHVQTLPEGVWLITHRLDFFPNITVVDSAGGVVEGEIDYIDRNTMRLRFSEPFAGEAYLS